MQMVNPNTAVIEHRFVTLCQRRSMKARTAVMFLFLGLMLLLSAGCQRVYYRFYDFQPAVIREGQMSVNIVLRGTESLVDSAGRHLERRSNPYLLRMYITSPPEGIEVLNVRLTGISSGTQTTLNLSQLRPLVGDTLHRLHAVTEKVTLPYDDHTIEVRVRFNDGELVRESILTGIFRKRFEQTDKNRLWERVMSV
jgi:hypothetical protein